MPRHLTELSDTCPMVAQLLFVEWQVLRTIQVPGQKAEPGSSYRPQGALDPSRRCSRWRVTRSHLLVELCQHQTSKGLCKFLYCQVTYGSLPPR